MQLAISVTFLCHIKLNVISLSSFDSAKYCLSLFTLFVCVETLQAPKSWMEKAFTGTKYVSYLVQLMLS